MSISQLVPSNRLARIPGPTRWDQGRRRKWASERKGHPISDVATAGGWRDKQTLLESYQRPDAATIQAVVLNKTRVLAVR